MSRYTQKIDREIGRPHRLSDDALLRRRCRELELWKSGMTKVDIAERMGLCPDVIGEDIKILMKGEK